MTSAAPDPSRPGPREDAAAGEPVRIPWGLWLAWTWVGLLAAAAVAEVFDVEALRRALDFQRHLRG